MALQRKPLSPYLGYEITGLDGARPISDEDRRFILDSWIEAGVLVFPGAGITNDAHLNISRVFGPLESAATSNLNVEGYPELLRLAYDPNAPSPAYNTRYTINGREIVGWIGWHWDQSFMPTIIRGAVLRMLEPAEEMGETGLIDAIGAYDRLPKDLKARIERLEVIYKFSGDVDDRAFGRPKGLTSVRRIAAKAATDYEFPAVVHPLVIRQPETGRKVLKLSPIHARGVVGMEDDEGEVLLSDLTEHLTDERYAYFHRWGKDDLLVWDNFRIIHSATGVPPHCRRIAQRTTISGDYGGGRYLDPSLDRDRASKRLID